MRDLLGRQGRQRRGDDARARRRARPGRLHDHHRGVRRLHEGRPGGARGHGRAGGRGARRASRSTPARRSATTRTRCSSPCAPARASRCPACSTRCSTSGSTTRRSRGSRKATENERFAWDSYRRFVQMFGNVVARHRGRAVRGRDQGDQGGPRRQGRHRARRRRAEGADRPLQGPLRVPAGPAGAAAPGDPRRLRLLDGRARGLLPAHQPHPRRLGHGGQRAADGVRQQGRHVRVGRGLLARRGHRRARAERRLPRQRPGRGRRLRRPQHARHRRDGRGDARGARGADGDPAHARGATTRTCRTRSSRSRRGSSTCSRRATPSGPPRPPCASRATRSTRSC